MTENLIKIQGFADGNAGISLYKADGIIHRIFLNADGRLRFGTYNNGDWNIANIITNANMQSGTATVNAAANGDTEFTVKFPNAFSSNPNVYVGVLTSRPDLRAASVISRTTSGFTGSVHNGTSAGSVAVFWTAVSP